GDGARSSRTIVSDASSTTPRVLVPPTSSPMVSRRALLDIDAANARRLFVALRRHLLVDELVGGVDHRARGLEQLVRRPPEVTERVGCLVPRRAARSARAARTVVRRTLLLLLFLGHANSTSRRSPARRAPRTSRRNRLSGRTNARRCGPTVRKSSSSLRP